MQHRFAVCWVILTVFCLCAKLGLEAAGIALTSSHLEDTYEYLGQVYKSQRVFTGFPLFDQFCVPLIWVGALYVIYVGWSRGKDEALTQEVVMRNGLVTLLFCMAYYGFGALRAYGFLHIRPSGHFLVYITSSYLHYHNAKTALIQLDLKLCAAVMLATLPFVLYCGIWTGLVFHTGLEVGVGVLTGLGITYLDHSLSFLLLKP